MAILITGGAGFIGSHVAEALLKQKEKILIVDNINDYYDPGLKQQNLEVLYAKGLERDDFYKADVTAFEELQKVFEKFEKDGTRIEKVIHLAARAGVRPSMKEPHLYTKVNVWGTCNILEVCRLHNVKRLVFGSSSSVYGENRKVPFSEQDDVERQVSPYASTKRAGEILCRSYSQAYGMSIACLRFFTVYGPRGRPDMAPRKFAELISQGKPIEMYGDGTTSRDYTYVEDIARGIIAALDAELDFEIVNLGNSRPVKLRKFISIIEEELGTQARILEKPMFKGDVPMTYADVAKAKELLDWQPSTDLRAGIRMMVEWMKSDS